MRRAVLVVVMVLSAACARGEALRVAMLEFGGIEPDPCFSAGFLEAFALETGMEVEAGYARVALEDGPVYGFPFAVAAGEGFFEMSAQEREALRGWLRDGGFLLASASCSNPAWGASMRAALDGLFEGARLEPIPMSHELFRSLHEIGDLPLPGRPEGASLLGLSLDGRLAVVFSPDGLNDAIAHAGGCCCCGGTQVGNARFVNANALAYALTR